MSIINFTAEFDLLTNETIVTGGEDVDTEGLVGDVRFIPDLIDDRPILARSYEPRPAGFMLRTFTGYLDSDGQLKSSRSGGSIGVRLWANDPVLELTGLTYRVVWDLTTPFGEPVRVDDGYFVAPDMDITVQLANVLKSSASITGPRLVGGEFVDGSVIFENQDGTTLSPIEIPNGVLVFVDNGDSTWSVG